MQQPFMTIVIITPGMPVDVLVQHAEVPDLAVRDEPPPQRPRRFWFDRNECGVLRSRLEN